MKFILLTIFVFILIASISYKYFLKYFKDSNNSSKSTNKTTINRWMSLSKDDRQLLDKKKQFNTMQRKQKLIENIRKEYRLYKDSK